MDEKDFLEVHKKGLEVFGFWEEDYKSSLITMYMSQFVTDIIRNYKVTDLIVKDNEKVLVKWVKRHTPLSDEELLEKWKRDVTKGE